MAYIPSSSSRIACARELGERFARYLNANSWGDKWSKMTKDSRIPQADHAILYQAFKFVSADMQEAYRQGFNATLR
jgi:hypothetical protein